MFHKISFSLFQMFPRRIFTVAIATLCAMLVAYSVVVQYSITRRVLILSPPSMVNPLTGHRRQDDILSSSVNDEYKIKVNDNGEHASRKQYLIYYCSENMMCGGLADRIKGMLGTHALATLTNRTFGVHVDHPVNIKTFMKPNKIKWDIDPKEIAHLSTKRFLTGPRKTFVNMLSDVNLNDLFKEDVIYFTINYRLLSELSENPRYKTAMEHYKYSKCPNGFSDFYHDMFQPSQSIRRNIDAFLRKAKPKPFIKLACAQVRMGKNPTIPNDGKVRNHFETLPNLWTFLRRYNDSRHFRLFVTTDSEEVRDKARELFPKVILDTDGPIIHIEKTSTDVSDGFEKVVLDQQVMGHCDELVFSLSGFGRLGALLRGSLDGLYMFAYGEVYPAMYINGDCKYGPDMDAKL